MSVMGVKRGTQAFSTALQASSPKSDGAQANGAEEFRKAFGDQDLGAVLNKVADPNWTDPSKKMRSVGDNQLDKDAFLKLMLAQMKHQDPTNPMQSHEMAAQLAQFTSLEQLNNINTTLESMKNAQAPSSNYQVLGFIGKKVSGDSSKLTRAAGDTRHAFNFELMGDAAKVKVTVKDAGGNVVRVLEPGGFKKGSNIVEWNGLTDDGMAARPGEYRFAIEAVNANGAKIYAKTSFAGRITGVNYTPQGPVLLVNGQSIKLSDVKKIEEAGLEEFVPAIPLEANAKSNSIENRSAGLVQSENREENGTNSEFVPPAEEPEVTEGNIQDVPMARDMMEKLAKST